MYNVIDTSTLADSAVLNKQELAFVRQIAGFNKDIPYSKTRVTEQAKAVIDYYKTLALETDPTADFVENTENIIKVITRSFNRAALILLCDKNGQIDFTSPERVILFYHYYKQHGTEEQKKRAEAISYVLLANIFQNEVSVINKVAGNGNIKANQMVTDLRNFGWRRCPYIFRGYMTVLGIEGHEYSSNNRYFIETHKQGYIGILTKLMGYSKKEAVELLRTQKTGLFYTFLPIDIEARLLEHILTNTMILTRTEALFNGIAVKALLRYEKELNDANSFSETNNAYVNIVRKEKINAMGLYIDKLSTFCREENIQDMYIYAMSDGYMAFTTSLDFKEVASGLSRKVKKVQYFPFDLEGYFV